MIVRAVFFDAGHTLMEPIGDSWFPGHRFFEIARSHGIEIADDEAFGEALAAGYAFLDANHSVDTLEQEEAQFDEYYRVILRTLGLRAPPGLTAVLAHAYVREVNFRPYDDARPVLDRLREMGLPLAVITDSWPSVEQKFSDLGFRDYFATFVISSQQGCVKPDPRMFEPALRAIGVAAKETLFIDDGPYLVEDARTQGFRGLVIDRAAADPPGDGIIRQLDELFAYLD